MKYALLLLSLMLFACGGEEPKPQNESGQHDAESKNVAAPNFKDGQGLKQGYWVIYGKDDPARGYPADGRIEEGNYKDDQKDGEWTFYKKNGMDVDSITEYASGGWMKTVFRDSVAAEIQ